MKKLLEIWLRARKENLKAETLLANHRVSLEDLYNQIKEGSVKELAIIVKADVQGSVEAIKAIFRKTFY